MADAAPPEVFEVHRRLSDGALFELLTEIPQQTDGFFSVQLRNQRTGRTHWATVAGLVKKYEREG